MRQNCLYASADGLIKHIFYWSPYIEFLIISLENHWHDFLNEYLMQKQEPIIQAAKITRSKGHKKAETVEPKT